MRNHGLAAWHRVMAEGNPPDELAKILADDAVFHSPVVHTPQVGKAKVIAYLAAAGQVFGAPGGSDGEQFRGMKIAVPESYQPRFEAAVAALR